jgi:hypothetical protein
MEIKELRLKLIEIASNACGEKAAQVVATAKVYESYICEADKVDKATKTKSIK